MATEGPGPASAGEAIELVSLLADEIGPRPPTSAAEREAAEALASRLREWGVGDVRLEPFHGYRTFAYPFAAIELLAVLPSALPSRLRRARSALALLAVLALVSEGALRRTPLTQALSRRASANVVAVVGASSTVQRTLCLSAHLDTSRSGLMFDPRLVRHLGSWITAQSLATIAQGMIEALLGGRAAGRRLAGMLRGVPAAGLGLLAERELRGVEVAGANDNASGAAVAATLAAELAAEPLRHTRLVLVLTGCEEAGTLGMRAFLREHETEGWLFLNFDNVGGDGSLRYLRREGVLTRRRADPGLVRVADSVAAAKPELRMAPEDAPAGLTYDSSPVLAAGGRALTVSVQDGFIPNLHQPSDTVANLDRSGVARALGAGREMVAAIDRGEAGA